VLRPTIRYLTAADVRAAMPPLAERLRLAERTMVALAGEAELPPKIGVHPRAHDSFGHAMPAHLRGRRPDGADDLVGLKWVVGYPGNSANHLPTIFATVIVNDPTTGIPTAILDGGPITAERTAAISGVVIGRFAPRVSGRAIRAGLIGAGVQGHSHVPVLGYLLPGVDLAIYDRSDARAEELAAYARGVEGIGRARAVADSQSAARDADVVVTAAAFGPVRQVMTDDWLAPDALVVAVDYATYVNAEVAREAGLFLVDEREQFLANRAAGLFEGYPDPATTFGEAIMDAVERPAVGRVVATHLGVGLADLIFADAIIRAAEAAGLGHELPR
jgi:ornithine cyclodeaminase/alanine dehydrogenase-like protein (mu-crystallin family)